MLSKYLAHLGPQALVMNVGHSQEFKKNKILWIFSKNPSQLKNFSVREGPHGHATIQPQGSIKLLFLYTSISFITTPCKSSVKCKTVIFNQNSTVGYLMTAINIIFCLNKKTAFVQKLSLSNKNQLIFNCRKNM